MRSNSITLTISTKNRNENLLILLSSILNQTLLPKEIIIYNDTKPIFNPNDNQNYCYYVKTFFDLGVEFSTIWGSGTGQVHNHQAALENCKLDYILRVDDDCVLEPNFVEELYKTISSDDKIGAVGPVIINPFWGKDKPTDLERNLISNLVTNRQWFEDGTGELIGGNEHLYSSFIYDRKKALKCTGYCNLLSSVGSREESLFTINLWHAGHELVINPKAKAYHFQQNSGGIRVYNNAEEMYKNDEGLFQRFLSLRPKYNNDDIIIAEGGIGDVIIFLRCIRRILEKRPDTIFAIMYDGFLKHIIDRDFSDVKFINFIDAKILTGKRVSNDLYKFMSDNKWTGTIEEAYLRMFAK